MKRETKNAITIYTALIMLAFGIIMATAGFIVSPLGEIHSSVLWIVAQCLIYTGSVLGVSAYAHGKITEINDELINQRNQINNFTRKTPNNATTSDVTSEDI